MMQKVTVIGAGSWGTALEMLLAGRHQVLLWGRDAAEMAAMQRSRANTRYLPDHPFPESLIEFLISFENSINNLNELILFINNNSLAYTKLYSELPSLNDIFLELTGKELRD